MTDYLEEEIEQRLGRFDQGTGYYYKPLTEAADEFIKFAEHPELRVSMGVPQFDDLIRGVAPGELCLINGFAHSGKTVLATEILMANVNEPVVMFTPDETRAAVLTKLAAATTGVASEELEARIYKQDAAARELLINVATQYQHLAVYDEAVTLHQMDVMFAEAEEVFKQKPKAVIFDYAEQLNEATDTKSKLDELKRWGKRHGVAMFVLHQTSRSAGAAGKALTIDSGSYGGEQQATFLIVVRRKINYWVAQLEDLEQKINNSSNPTQIEKYEERMREIRYVEIPAHENTVSMKLVKNKRHSMRLTPELDFTIDPENGRLKFGDEEQEEQEEKVSGGNDLNETSQGAMSLLFSKEEA